jgi:3-oxoacyl-[acyl-carrier-protein] synthase III
MKLKISSIAYHLPAFVEGIDVLKSDNPDWIMPKILEKTGIITRHIAAEDETAVDLAFKAGTKLLDDGSANRNEIDLLILVTQSPDYVLPSSACILQDKLGLSKSCMAFDVNLGCSGFVYALSIAGGLIESGVANKGIILCADTYSKYIEKDNRTCRPIFSDGAAAVLVDRSETDDIGPFEFGTDGSGFDKLIVKGSGARESNGVTEQPACTLEMYGSNVFLFTMSVVPKSVENLLERTSKTLEDIDLIVFHQASKLVIDTLIKRLSLDVDKVFTNYESVGNTVSATIPIALKDAVSQGRLHKGDTVMIVGFGVGLSWGATLIEWSMEK